MMITIEKCPCGQCRDYHLVGIGKFCQGSGFTEEEATKIASLLNESGLHQLKHDNSLKIQNDDLVNVWVKLDRKRKSLDNFDEVDQLHDFKEEVSNFHDVRQFHEKFGLLIGPSPQHLTDRKLQERMEFMVEELWEFCKACGWELNFDLVAEEFHQDLAAQADALIDLVYVAMGTAVMLGLPWTQLWDDVQRANMAKVRGETHRGHPVDVSKPPGWVGPKTEQILEIFGYKKELHNKEELYVDDEL